MTNLQVQEPKAIKMVPAVIEYNDKVLDLYLDAVEAEYENLVVTEDDIQGSKKVCSSLNKLAANLDNFRKTTKKELEVNIHPFEEAIKERFSRVKNLRAKIDDQVKYFEAERKKELRLQAMAMIDQTRYEIELNAKFFEMVVIESEYTSLGMNPTKMKKLIVKQFETLKLLQDMEDMKINTMLSIIEAYNDKLMFKFSINDFSYLLEEDIQTISATVKEKVQQRFTDEQAEIKRMEDAKIAAVEAAKVEMAAKAKAAEEAVEQKHQQELYQAEQTRLAQLRNAEAAKQRAIEDTLQVVEQVSNIVPNEVDPNKQERKFNFKIEVVETEERIKTLKLYLDQFGFKYKVFF